MVNFGQIKPISRSIRQKKKIYYQIKFPSLHTFSCDGKIFSHFPLSLSLARFLLLTSKKLYCCCASLTKRHFYPTADAAADEIYFFVCMSNKLLSVCVCVLVDAIYALQAHAMRKENSIFAVAAWGVRTAKKKKIMQKAVTRGGRALTRATKRNDERKKLREKSSAFPRKSSKTASKTREKLVENRVRLTRVARERELSSICERARQPKREMWIIHNNNTTSYNFSLVI